MGAMKPTGAEQRTPEISRLRIIISAIVTAVAAALFVVLFFGILTPPLDPSTLLNPPKQRPTLIRPTPAVFFPTPRLFTQDDFSTRTNWVRADNYGGASFADKGYALFPDPARPYTHVYLSSLTNTEYRDLTLQIDASASAGSAAGYGVFFWHSQDSTGNERFVYFGVTTDGAYTLRANEPITQTAGSSVSRRWLDLILATSSAAVRKGSGSNKLRVEVHPKRIRAFVNGTLVIDEANQVVDALRDRNDFDGKVGLLAYSLDAASAKVLFTLFAVDADLNK